MSRRNAAAIALLIAAVSGLPMALLSQASTTDYHKFFWVLLPFALTYVVSGAVCFWLYPFRMRCAIAVFSVLGLGSFIEMAIRVWL